MSAKYGQWVPDQNWLTAKFRRLEEQIADANRRGMKAANSGGGSGTGGGTTTYTSGYTQTFSSAATWTVSVPAGFGRVPEVGVYSTTGERVWADVVATSSTVTITFAVPYSGTVLLT